MYPGFVSSAASLHPFLPDANALPQVSQSVIALVPRLVASPANDAIAIAGPKAAPVTIGMTSF